MAHYVLTYYGGNHDMSPEEGAKHREKFMIWVQNLGKAMINPGTPLGTTKIVSSTSVSDDVPNRLTGFSVVEADSLDAAVAIAQKCPFLDIGGTIGVSQEMQM